MARQDDGNAGRIVIEILLGVLVFVWYAGAVVLLYAVLLAIPLVALAASICLAIALITLAAPASALGVWALETRIGAWIAELAPIRHLLARREAPTRRENR